MRLPQFFLTMDKKALRAVSVLVMMFLIVAVIITWARGFMTVDDGELSRLLISLKSSGLALPVTIFIFIVASFIGMPQWVLIAICVAAFGPVTGGGFAWVATLCSASVNFWLARLMGAAQLEVLAGKFVTRIVTVIKRNAVLTSFAVRLVPTGPFILVNMAAGVSGMAYVLFMLGTALGIMPKIIMVALLGQGVLESGDSRMALLAFAGAAGVVILLMLLARRYLRRFVDLGNKTQ
ncbi:TVP38/TMEM64 family protein [Fretibacter rubidus]|uniref:TVP38/TMEM64 family protein n=1 Tax=Fretibacter rubidus TaxID=570162 RepID=UPI003529F0BB